MRMLKFLALCLAVVLLAACSTAEGERPRAYDYIDAAYQLTCDPLVDEDCGTEADKAIREEAKRRLRDAASEERVRASMQRMRK